MLKHLSLQKKLMLSYIFLILCILLLTAVFVLPIQLRDRKNDLENELRDTALIFSSDPSVVSGLKNGRFSGDMITRFDEIIDQSGNGYIVIADRESIRLYHPNHTLIGGEFAGGDQEAALQGEEHYTTEVQGTTERQLRAFHVVQDETGTVIGFVMVSNSMASIHALQRSMYLYFITVCLIIFFIGMVLAYAISEGIRRILLGNDPPTFAKMFLQREEILNHLSEGILAFDESRKAVYSNAAGAYLFPDDVLERENLLYPTFSECMETGDPKTELMVELGGKSCLANLIDLEREGLFHLVMVILRDRTEIVRLTEQVTGTNHIVDALRANTHEFMNKLHVISGLLQVGETEQVIDFIGDISGEVEAGYQTVVRTIQNRAVAALILGKFSRAKELNIQFSLRQDSQLIDENPFLSTQELITLIGNLVENAFDAMGGKQDSRQVELHIGCDEQCLQISVDDTGRGMDAEQIERIYHGQYTTKGAGHGYGMRLIREIVRSHCGFLQIDSEPDIGSSISVIFVKDKGKNLEVSDD